MALTVAGTRAPLSHCASFRAARMLAAVRKIIRMETRLPAVFNPFAPSFHLPNAALFTSTCEWFRERHFLDEF